jgi:hypothetical protein
MNKKRSLASLISDIDKIVLYGKTLIFNEGEDCDKEDKEILLLAQLLAKADYSIKSPNFTEKIFSNARRDDELIDDELDMVAGGLNTNEILDD